MKAKFLIILFLCCASLYAQLSDAQILEKGYEFYQTEKAKLDAFIAKDYNIVVYAEEAIYKSLGIKDQVKWFDEYCEPPAQNDDTQYVMIDFKKGSSFIRVYLYVFTCGNTENAPTIMYDINPDGSVKRRSELNWK